MEKDSKALIQPSEEYPGEWMLCHPDNLQRHWNGFCRETHRDQLKFTRDTLEEAKILGTLFLDYLEKLRINYHPHNITICWKASYNDPRAGQAGFISVYQHGYFNIFGGYCQT